MKNRAGMEVKKGMDSPIEKSKLRLGLERACCPDVSELDKIEFLSRLGLSDAVSSVCVLVDTI